MSDHGWDTIAGIAGGFFPVMFVFRLMCMMFGLEQSILAVNVNIILRSEDEEKEQDD